MYHNLNFYMNSHITLWSSSNITLWWRHYVLFNKIQSKITLQTWWQNKGLCKVVKYGDIIIQNNAIFVIKFIICKDYDIKNENTLISRSSNISWRRHGLERLLDSNVYLRLFRQSTLPENLLPVLS